MSTAKTADQTIFARRESEARSYCRSFDAVFTKGQNATLTDTEGREYIDFLAGCSSLNYGHNDPDMKAALMEHIAGDGIAHGLDMMTDAKARFLETFEKIVLEPRGMDHKIMMTGPTGTNAVEAALKLARKVTGRRDVIAFTNGFHGMSLGALAATGNAGKRHGAGGAPLDGIARMPYEGAFGPDVDTLAQIEMLLDNPSSGIDAPAAFLVELVQGEGGLNAASKEWVEGIARIAKKHGSLLIVDDIQAGIGRTGDFFSFDGMDVEPDMVTLAKSLSGFGLPFAVMLMKRELDIWKPAEHNGTFRGNNHAFVTSATMLDEFWSDDSFAQDVRRGAGIIEDGLEAIARKHGGGLYRKGRGMMQGISCPQGDLAGRVVASAFQQGLIIETSGADDAFRNEVAGKAGLLEERLSRIAEMVPGARLKGRGMMRGVDVGSGELAEEICAEAFRNGLVIETSGAHDEVVKVLAPLTIPRAQFEEGLTILENAARTCTGTTKIAAE